jgi:hypothetical protein
MSETDQETPQKLHPILRGALERVEEEGVLEEGEEIVDRELAGMKRSPGVLIVTGRRVLFYRTSTVGGGGKGIVSLPLAEITDVEASERRSPIRKRGVLRLGETVVEHIPGGQQRAEQLAATIERERAALRHGPDSQAD